MVAKRIEGMLGSVSEMTFAYSCFGTKLNAIETICNIFDIALSGDDALSGSVYQNLVGWGDHLVHVASLFTRDERQRLSETVLAKLDEVADDAREHDVDEEEEVKDDDDGEEY